MVIEMGKRFYILLFVIMSASALLLSLSYASESGRNDEVALAEINKDEYRVIFSNSKKVDTKDKMALLYQILSKELPQSCIDEMHALISDPSTTVETFNGKLMTLFMTIPRAMDNTRYHIAHSKADFGRIIEREASYLDSLRGIVGMYSNTKSDDESEKASAEKIISRYGLEVWDATDEQVNEVKRLMSASKDRIRHVWRVENGGTRKKFDEYVKKRGIRNVKKLFHGSRTENFLSIISNGLLLDPKAVITGKMFGYGIYFAPSAQKSIGYTSVYGSYWASGKSSKGYLAVYDVAVGKPLDVHSYGSYSSFTEKDMKANGTDSLFAHKGSMLRNDEVIVYNEAAATIRYLVEIE